MDEIKQSRKLFLNIYKNRVKINLIIENIKNDLIKLLGNLGITVAISDLNGNIKYMDPEMTNHYKYIQDYCKSNGQFLDVGTFSIPSRDVVFFRISERVIIALSSNASNVNCLVTFACKMDKYKAILNNVIDKIKTVNYWDTAASSENLFASFQESRQSEEIEELFKLVEISLNKLEFERTLEILNTIKKVYLKLDKHSITVSYIDKVMKKIEARLHSRKDVDKT